MYDVVVIGAGLGGLTAGALLAKGGKKVLLLERHYRPGGCATVFKRKGFDIEVGLHELDGLAGRDFKLKLFEELGVFEKLQFIKVPEFYRFVKGDVDITCPHGYDEAVNAYVRKFPHEEKGIRKFFGRIKAINADLKRFPRSGVWAALAAFLMPVLYPPLKFGSTTPLGEFMDSVISDEDVKFAILANLGYYSDDPYTASMLYYSVAQMSYLSGGGHFIKGGSQKLSDHLAGIITSNGGEVKLRHEAKRIVVKEGRVAGVEYVRVSGEGGKVHLAECRFVAANASIPDVVNKLAPEVFEDDYKKKVNSLKIACSFFCVYLGFNKTPKELGNMAYSTFVVDEKVLSLAEFKDPEKNGLADKGYTFVDYSQIDSGLAPEGKSVGVIVTLDYLFRWEGLSKEEYQAKKEKQASDLVDRLEKLIPGIKDHIEYMEAATPVTMKRFTANPRGAAYGFAQTPEQAGVNRLQNESPVKGLYYCSAWGMPGGGFSGAMYAGRDCARKILKRS